MDKQRTRRLLLVAFALSLLVHTLFAAFVHWHAGTVEQTPQVIDVRITHPMRIARIVPTPPPTPPPSPRPAPSAPHLTRRTTGAGPGRSDVAQVPTPAPSVAPTPVSSATPNCQKLDIPASISQTPDPPEIAPAARADATNGTARIRVQLDTNGNVTGTAVIASSGSTSMDLVAVELAKAARYAPATHQCKTVASTYDFTARFYAW